MGISEKARRGGEGLVTSAGLALKFGVGSAAALGGDVDGIGDVVLGVVAGGHQVAEAPGVHVGNLRAACRGRPAAARHGARARRHIVQAARLRARHRHHGDHAHHRHDAPNAAITRHSRKQLERY